MNFFRCENITRSYQNIPTIKDINLYLNKGEIVGLLGSSGVGKTTLFNILTGVEPPDSGNVFLENEDITGVSGRVGYMLQKDLLLDHRNIIDNVSLPLIIRGEPKALAREQANVYFSDFGLDGYQLKYPYQLSGGMRQRAALLRTFLMNSQLTFLDEPFSALDAITKSQMHSWYLDIVSRLNLTTLFITHDIDEALLLSHRIYILAGSPGKIVKVFDSLPSWSRESDYSSSIEFASLKKEITDLIHKNLI